MRWLLVTCLAAALGSTAVRADTLSGDWGGVRTDLAERGVALDIVYAGEAFLAHGHLELLGHLDAAITVDAPWPGARLYALGQNNHGQSVDDAVGSATQISNLEAPPYTQLSELFLEQALGPDVSVRLGKQDANRDFGTPRFGGNFINNNFGMFPTAPLPSYPTTGLGASVGVTHAWLAARAAIYEGNIVAGVVAVTQPFEGRDAGTQSLGVWRQAAALPATDGSPRTFDHDAGFYVQLDERFYTHPAGETGFTAILRFSWAQADRTEISRYLGGSIAYHGLGHREDDTVGIGVGYFTVGAGDEEFLEAFYKWRVTAYASLQPDLELYRHPGGAGRDALLVGARLKLKI